MTKSHWLCSLQMGKTWHDGIGIFRCQTQDAFCNFSVIPGSHRFHHGHTGGYLSQPGHYGYGPYAIFTGNADTLSQARLNVHMHIFKVNAPFEVTCFNICFNGSQTFDNVITFLFAQYVNFASMVACAIEPAMSCL